MNGWTVPTTVFLVAAAILCAALLTIHYAPRAWRWVGAQVAHHVREYDSWLAQQRREEAGR